MKKTILIVLALIFSLLPACSNSPEAKRDSHQELSTQKAAIPQTGWVTDAAQVLAISEKERIAAKLYAFERKTGSQMVVVTVAALGGKDIKTFTNDLGNAWGIGRKGYNDGIILLVAPDERQARIATGSGLRAKLPDSVCQQIMVRQIVPRLRKGELDAGIEAGVAALAVAIEHGG